MTLAWIGLLTGLVILTDGSDFLARSQVIGSRQRPRAFREKFLALPQDQAAANEAALICAG